MASPTKTEETNPEPPKKGFFSSPAHLTLLVVVFLVLLIGGILISKNRETEPTTPASQSDVTKVNASMTMEVDNKTPAKGEVVSVDIWANSGNSTVNAAQAVVNYSASDFSFIDIDGSKSNFEITAQSSEKNGVITIARAHKGRPLTGRQLVSTIKLKVLVDNLQSSLKFDEDTVLLSAVNNKDILSSKTGADFNVGGL